MTIKKAMAFAEWSWSCPHCQNPETAEGDVEETTVVCPSCGEAYEIVKFDNPMRSAST